MRRVGQLRCWAPLALGRAPSGRAGRSQRVSPSARRPRRSCSASGIARARHAAARPQTEAPPRRGSPGDGADIPSAPPALGVAELAASIAVGSAASAEARRRASRSASSRARAAAGRTDAAGSWRRALGRAEGARARRPSPSPRTGASGRRELSARIGPRSIPPEAAPTRRPPRSAHSRPSSHETHERVSSQSRTLDATRARRARASPSSSSTDHAHATTNQPADPADRRISRDQYPAESSRSPASSSAT